MSVRTAPRVRATITLVAVAAVTLVFAVDGSAVESTHILVGVTAEEAFNVSTGGELVEAGPFVSDSLGVLGFAFEDPGQPVGTLTVGVAPAGEPVPLVIAGISAAATESTAVIEWTTDRPATAVVEYGPTVEYGTVEERPSPLQTSHSITLTDLEPSTLYHFRVAGTDSAGVPATSGDETFTTSDPPPLQVVDAEVADGDSTWARLVWTTNRPATSWVEFGTSEAYGSQTQIDGSYVTSHDVVVDGLSPGVVYHFRALSGDAFADTAASGDLVFETPLPPPPPLTVTDVTVTAVDTTTATITWTTNRASDSAVEYGETDTYGSSTDVDPAPVTQHQMTLIGLEPGTLYHFRVRSSDGVDVVHSDDGVFETDLTPLAIAGVSVGNVGTSWAVISWTTTRPATSVVEYGPTDSYGDTASVAGLDTAHEVTLEGLDDETLYHFRVRSADAYESVAVSPDSTFETMSTGPMGPPIITDVSSEPLSATSVAVTWSTDRPATSQVLYGAGDSLDCATPVLPELVTEHRVVVGPVVPRLEYTFMVRSACGADTSSCDSHAFETSAPAYGLVKSMGPRIVSSGTALTTESTSLVRWTIDRPCTTWIEWGADTSYGQTCPGEPAWRVPRYVYEASLSSLESLTVYHYRIVAVGAHGDTTYSDDCCFRTEAPLDEPGDPDDPDDPELPDTEPPPAPAGVAARTVARDVVVEWEDTGADDLWGYQVYRARAGDEARGVRINHGLVTSPRYVDRSVAEGTYWYTVTAVDTAGNESELSEPAEVDFSLSSEHQLLLEAYPNPTRGRVSFSFVAPPGSEPATLSVYSVDGRLVRSIAASGGASGETRLVWDGLDGRGAPVGSGIYLCRLRAGGIEARRKVTVLH
ncbi:MAG: T9SS type A sorting domain-containing protein [Candidatus Eisenbacteria bacterium]|nr:T9SS type A sorting domain-containing protein [Candidatus Eisenbacteria bacterium]